MPLRTFICAALLTATGAAAQADMGALQPLLPKTGADGPWAAVSTADAFAIANAQDAGAIRYYYLNTAEGHDKSATVSVELVDGEDQGFAAIVFGFDEGSRNYHLFAAHNDGTYSIFRRNESGFSQVISTSLDNAPSGVLELSITENGDEVSYAVNGDQLGAIGSNGLGEGGIGIAVGGIVSATFSDFKLTDASN